MTLRLLRAIVAAVGILFSCNLATAQDDEVELKDGGIGIGFVLPPGLTRFSDQQMALVREKGVNAKFIFSDSKTNRLLVVNTFGSNANEAGLSKVADDIVADARKAHTDVQVLKRSLIKIKSKKWLQLSFKQGAGPNQTIETYLVTDWVGRYVLLDFSASVADYDNYKAVFEKSIKSIQLSLIAEAPASPAG